MKSLSVDAVKHPIENIILTLLLFFAMVFMPTNKIFTFLFGDGFYVFSSIYVSRFIFSLIFTVLLLLFGFKKLFYNFSIKGLVKCIPAFFIAVSIFPIYSVIKGDIVFTDKFLPRLVEYFISTFSIALVEELAFRGIIFILLIKIFSEKKHSVILTVFVSSLIFALVHYVNVLSSPFLTVTLQVLYCLFTGAVFTFSLVLTKNIFVPIILHFLLDIGGLITQTDYFLAVGNMGLYDYVISVSVGIVCGLILLYFLIKTKKEDLSDLV